jgi:hypothetical protein
VKYAIGFSCEIRPQSFHGWVRELVSLAGSQGEKLSLLSKCGLLSNQTPAQTLPENFAFQIFNNDIYYNRKVGMGTPFNLKEKEPS